MGSVSTVVTGQTEGLRVDGWMGGWVDGWMCMWMGGWVGLQKLITDLDMRNGHKGGL